LVLRYYQTTKVPLKNYRYMLKTGRGVIWFEKTGRIVIWVEKRWSNAYVVHGGLFYDFLLSHYKDVII